MRTLINVTRVFVMITCLAVSTVAAADTLTFTKLSALTGTPPNNETAVYRASLSGLSGDIASIVIQDGSTTSAGSPGQFSGFDLDAIKISSMNCNSASCAANATGLNVFNFGSGIVFSHGTQTAPTDPKLFGTDASGNAVNNSVATLGQFDAVSSTSTPNGFVSLGVGGTIAFNLTSSLSGAGLYLYIGEVGDNGEVASSNVRVSSTTVSALPEPSSWALLIGGFGIVGVAMRRRQDRVAIA